MDEIPYIIKVPENYEQLLALFKGRTPKDSKIILQRIRDYYHVSLDKENKNKQKKLFELLLEYIDKLDLKLLNDFLSESASFYVDFDLIFHETTNSFFRSKLADFESLNHSKDLEKQLQKIFSFSKYSIIFHYLSLNEDMSNQYSFNYILIANILSKRLLKLNKGFWVIISKVYLLNAITLITVSSKSFNPSLMNLIEKLISNIPTIVKSEINDTEIKSFNIFDDTIKDVQEIKFKLVKIIMNCLSLLINHLSNDINFDILFENIFQSIRLLLDENLEDSNSNLSTDKREEIRLISEKILKIIFQTSEKCKNKKNTHINFILEKKKEIKTLEPEFDPEFDFNLSWVEKKKALQSKTRNNIEKKLKKTTREAIRNIKKESRMIDIERQKDLEKLSQRRKEDMKLSNQFIEQTNIEYKKLVTSQQQKRNKKKRAPRKAGNDV